MSDQSIILLGGSGFIGKRLAFALANRGFQVTIPCRRPYRHPNLRLHTHIRVLESNVFDPELLQRLCQNHSTVINLIGILHESRSHSFRKVHVDFIKLLLTACRKSQVKRLLHLSALGADQANANSLYLRSKGEGENLLHTFCRKNLEVTSFQPSVVFGHDDQFINRFASTLKLCVGVFPLPCPKSKLMPVYVGDLIERVIDSLDDSSTYSQRIPVCGPEVLTLQQIIGLLIASMGLSCRILPLGNRLSKLQAIILQNLPGKLFTLDNYRSLQTANICTSSERCTTSLRHYMHNMNPLFDQQKYYDQLRRNYTIDATADTDLEP